MGKKAELQNAYKHFGKEATFYDGTIPCSTIATCIIEFWFKR